MFDGVVYTKKNFASHEECVKLTEWALAAKDQGIYVPGISRDSNANVISINFRYTTRLNTSGNLYYDPLVYEIQDRIISHFNIKDLSKDCTQGLNGVISSITFDGGDVYSHCDGIPQKGKGLSRWTTNLLVSKPDSGGLVEVEDKVYDLDEGEIMSYLNGEKTHAVKTCYGKPRILFMFGFHMLNEDWESGKYIPQEE